MSHRTVPSFLRHLSDTGPPDADLLGQFARDRDEAAFATLVRRHGRLVWAVCHHLAGADAEDAFQATFLVLVRHAGKPALGRTLSAWLYGVAYRVCLKSRLAARRRSHRERVAAVRERGNAAVPDAAWDRTFAAVHEEVARLPQSLRLPLVLCVLEGASVTAAAERLEWKVSTLSARLTRAKSTLLSRLAARGVTVGSLALLGVAATAVPAAAMAGATAMVGGGSPVAGSILQLTRGVVGMSAYRVKRLAAGVLLALGVSVGGGVGWVATVEAQQPSPTEKLTPDERVRQLERQLELAKREAQDARDREELKRRMLQLKEGADRADTFSTANWEYQFEPVRSLAAAQFVKALRERESLGWDYGGQTTLARDGKDGPVWVFRRPVKRLKLDPPALDRPLGEPLSAPAKLPPPTLDANGRELPTPPSLPFR